ncbi:nSTAND1 domain-containing NTPase [Sphaerospermopsis aphanizomenoides]|uniref:nSTAND1 domain-containing NTPase n=1 Tax=Sphaerospermopsis aphanizomenoides TaxID=459663 RepID=UPI0019080FB7|nr:caspase family protein [Sphaerospermopsis aphanizomenoides]
MTRYALVIGISQYSYFGQLPTPTGDAEAIAQILEKYGNFQQVRRYPYRRNIENHNYPEMVNQPVTGMSVMQQLQEFLSKQAEDSEALIYFTGHGITVSPYLGNSEGFLAASDCQLERDGSRIIGQKNGIPFSKLNEEIRNSHLSNLVVILDCCHSGYFIERNLLESSFNAFSAQKDYYLIAGCRSFQEGKIIKGESHSVFTTALIKAFSEENADPKRSITGDRLFDSISRELYGSVQEAIRFGWGKSIQLLTYPPQENDLENIEITLNIDNPYLGLKSFDLEQAYLFHGRQNAVRALLERLTNSRFLAVIGASGCGKSSLVKAGLLHELSDNYFAGSSNWKREILTPGSHPLYKLQEVLDHHPDNQPYILFIDQFEEIFTLTQSEEERIRFIQLIANEVTNQEKQTRVIIAMRGDFLDKCAEYPEAANLINQNQITSYLVQPLSLEELEVAIAQPAKLHGVTFESGLVSKIIDDVAQQPGALPLMQYALKELWDACIQNKSNENSQLTFAGYQKIGEVKGALEKTANRLYNSLTAENDKKFIRRLFAMELVNLGDGKEVTRKRANWERLKEIVNSESQLNNIISRLVDARLIVTTEKTVEVAHEALFSEWSLLKNWITDSRDDIRLSQSLQTSCREWREIYHKSDDALLTGARLAAIEEWKERTLEKLPEQEEDYIRRSIEKRDKDQQETIVRIERELEQVRKLQKFAEIQLQVARFQKIATIIVSGLLLFSASLGILSYRINLQKDKEQLLSVINLRDEAKKDYYDKHDQIGALMTSVKALDKLNKINLDKDKTNEIRDDIKTIVYGVKERNRLEGHGKKVWSISISPDGDKIVSASADNTIKLWSIKGKLLDTFLITNNAVNVVRFSNKNNDIIVSGSEDGYLILWKIVDDKLVNISTKKVSNTYIYDVTFGQDDKIIAFSCADGTINTAKLSEYSQLEQVTTIFKEPINNNTISQNFSLDFRLDANTATLAYSYQGSNINILNIPNKTKIWESINRDNTAINKIRFSPDGKLLAFAKNNGEIKILDSTKNYTVIGKIQSYLGLLSIAFNQNNQIATSYRDIDKGILFWDIDKVRKNYKPSVSTDENTTSYEIQLLGHQEDIKDISFNPQDPWTLISASGDTTIKIWDLKENSNISNLLEDSCLHIKDYLLINKDQNKQNIQEVFDICQQFL